MRPERFRGNNIICPADVGDREFWAWARDMRPGLAPARWNIALICARTRLCVSARGGTRESEREKRERGETNRLTLLSRRERSLAVPANDQRALIVADIPRTFLSGIPEEGRPS